ncbi:MAG: hypothetical protein H7067_02545 [Burkholderiales bacterium]|nr:hypothetical protein [Opitutaceae bacterium]
MVKPCTVHTDCGHEVALEGAWSVAADAAPSLLQRTDEDFIGSLLEELQTDSFANLTSTYRPAQLGDDGLLRLYQPVHRAFNLALLEAHCTGFGKPRLDARQIDSAGLVVRRLRTVENTLVYDAWCASKRRTVGWVPLPSVTDPDHKRDPLVARRPTPRYTADPEFDRARFAPGDQHDEETTSLFVAPAPVATHTGRTVLYGVIPVTSSSRAGALPRGAPQSDTDWSAHLSLLLRAHDSTRTLWPAITADDRAEQVSPADLQNFPIVTPDSASPNPGATRFILLVRQLAQEFGLLRSTNPATVDALVSDLNTLRLDLVDGSTRRAGDYLRDAARLYFEEPTPTLSLPRPHRWPVVSAADASRFLNRLRQLSSEIELGVFSSAQNAGRYDDPTARYVIRAFIRVKQPCDCPPKIVWSPYSEAFAIAPWFEPGPVGPTPIALPDLTPDFLRKAKPNVAFSVPASLANVLNQDPKKFLDGTAGKGSGFTLDWICGFSIPIITICAFIVLNIFLGLLHFIFRWLPFVKICIPFPRKK